MCTSRGFLARGLRVHRMNSGTMTVRDQYDTLSRWNGNQLRQQHDLDGDVGHAAPGHLAEQRQRDAREHVGARRAAALENRGARAHHVRRIGLVARELQRVVGLDACS